MRKLVGFIGASILGAVVALLIFKAIQSDEKALPTFVNGQPYPASVHFVDQHIPARSQVLTDFTVAADKTIHAVVHIKTEYERSSSNYNYYFDWRDFFGDPRQDNTRPAYTSAGSGVIISEDGYIVTNNHVIKDADRIEVTLNNKRTYEASVIGTDPSTDLALVKIDCNELPFIEYGDSDDLKIGEWVLAVGNPFNLTSTVTAGIVSAKARNINILQTPDNSSAIESFIQTDAAVNRGNSGGALVNTRGELVGINAAIASGTGFYAGYSFAIPVNILKKVVRDLMEFGIAQRAMIGVQIRDLDSELADELGVNEVKGVYVAGLTANGSAKEAGISVGDIIVGIDNAKINSTSELLEAVGQRRPGDDVLITVNRKNKKEFIRLTLKNVNGTTEIVQNDFENYFSMLGATFESADKNALNRLHIDYGVKVVGLEDGKLYATGIRKDFIITKIDKAPIRTITDIKDAFKHVTGGVLIEGVYPDGMRAYYGIGF
ncbi:MAG: trypsin-like peptidase domain-containing protein [Bacteroidales bacterium]|nr:trypsin-like peptidase domain-containing protein [Bacteroidales bacterium]